MYHSRGIIKRYEQQVRWRQFLPKSFKKTNITHPVEIKNVGPIIQIVSLLYITAAIILFFEWIFVTFLTDTYSETTINQILK